MPEKLDLQVLGTSGLKQFSGTIDEEFHPKLRGSYGIKVYREMSDNSSTIGAIQFVIDSLIRQVEWRVETASDDPESKRWAGFLEECQADMETSFDDFISEVLSFLIYGWAYFEIIYKMRRGYNKDRSLSSKYEDGKIGWRDFGLRSQDTLDRWEFDKANNRLLGMHQSDLYTGKYAFIPIEKALHFVTRKYKNNPEGRSIYRNAVTDYWFMKKIAIFEAIGVERDLAGIPTMEVPIHILRTTASAEDKALRVVLEKMLAELKNDERAFILLPSEVNPPDGNPTGYRFRLLSSGGAKQIDTNAIIQRYKTNILQASLAQFLELGLKGVGSFALASSQTNLFSMAIGTYLDIIKTTIQKQGVEPLMRLNNCPIEYMPELVHGDVESPPLDEIGAYIQALASAGQLPEDDRIKRKLLEFGNLHIPEVDEDIETRPKTKAPLKGVSSPKNVVIANDVG